MLKAIDPEVLALPENILDMIPTSSGRYPRFKRVI